MRGLYWFRSDLRIMDNLALAQAMRSSERLIAVFILSPTTWKAHAVAPCKIQFLLENLSTLSAALWKQGIPLLIRHGPSFSDAQKVLNTLCNQHAIDAIYFNHEYPLDERRRDETVINKLGDRLLVSTYDQQLVLAPGKVLSKQNTPFKIFTAFKNAWLNEAHKQRAWHTCTDIEKPFKSDLNPDLIPKKIDGFTDKKIASHWAPGENAAQKKLNLFCQKEHT